MKRNTLIRKRLLSFALALALAMKLLTFSSSADASQYISTSIDGHSTNYVTIDMSTGVRADMILADGTLNSTQSVASMAESSGAFAAINGTYFSAYDGYPVPWGTIIQNGKLLHIGTGAVAGFTSSGKLLVDRLNFRFSGYVNGTLQFYPWRLNHPSEEDAAITIFTPEYHGTVTPPSGAKIVLVDNNKRVTSITAAPFTVPDGGLAIEFNMDMAYLVDERFQLGDIVTYEAELQPTFTEPAEWDSVTAAVGAGPSLIINGIVTADGEAEGFTEAKINTSKADRSFIGAAADGKIYMGTINNATLTEAAAVCQKLSLVNAMCLDGGGSSGLYFNGSIVAGREINNALGFFYPENLDEYIYDADDPGENVVLPVELLDTVQDVGTASKAVSSLTSKMTDKQKTSATGIDLATLFAETAAAKASSQAVNSGDILINAAVLSELESTAIEAIEAVDSALTIGGVTPARELFRTVTLTTDANAVTIHIDPDVLTTNVDRVRVETPSYVLTFHMADLTPDLTRTLTFSASDMSAARVGGKNVGVVMPDGGTSSSITVSLPSDSGDTTYQTVAAADGTAAASKYNPATTKIDGKINQSGTYTVITNEKDFTDISGKSQEMQEAIRYLASKGIIAGRTATTFDPDGSITRAEIATLLVKALGKLDSSATANFTDVNPSNWYYSAAASSQKHGLINGFEDNTFRGTTNINKVQIIVVSSRVLTSEMKYKTPSNPSTYLSKYSDTVANWAQPEVALATRENLVVYRTDGTFSGDKNMTRGDAAIIIYRLFQRIW